ncbi:Card1-like endonuclease domain-containing protein [Taibaiella chishuiensis]|uniref:Uncharacterized protein DUF1887 n=1 Tax=Taibaiella chishuiensis TaxID=1434707 RepID=A0A2P8D4U2_9BACT|nr:DUF1887 family CARF protein [Taibaiella chishuiensis]PSK92227.1 uncharacterized protein DUF1887 [Taibaiella chishuiensis]
MKHQITLVGGQLLPVFIGIKEFNPDRVYFIVSNESKGGLPQLKSVIKGISFSEHSCNAYDFTSVKNTCEKILDKIDPNEEVSFNLTGGTKVMVLAIQSIIHDRSLPGFYINQDNTFWELPNYTKKAVSYHVTTKEFLEITGHSHYLAKTLQDFDQQDLKIAREIERYASNGKNYSAVTSYFRKHYQDQAIPVSGNKNISNDVSCIWDATKVEIFVKTRRTQSFKSTNVRDLFFYAGWWELLVAEAISKWAKAKEILVKFELPFKHSQLTKKNEIDILINLNNKLIFVECKSGNVKQEDINKMKVIKQTYGGLISKSILVSRYMPSPTIIEKCKELEIEVFFMFGFKNQPGNSFQKLITKLNQLEKRNSL